MITLNGVRRTAEETKAITQGHLYKDIKLDFETSRFLRDELYSNTQPRDLDDIQDARAVINSVKNILTTTPGQKLLNPRFGLDLRNYIFEPVSNVTSFFIVSDVYENLGRQEPRITLESVTVAGDADRSQYDITIVLSIPNLDIYGLNLKATLNRDGYVVV